MSHILYLWNHMWFFIHVCLYLYIYISMYLLAPQRAQQCFMCDISKWAMYSIYRNVCIPLFMYVCMYTPTYLLAPQRVQQSFIYVTHINVPCPPSIEPCVSLYLRMYEFIYLRMYCCRRVCSSALYTWHT